MNDHLMKLTNLELSNLLMEKMDSKPIIKLKDRNYRVHKHLPDSSITIIYNDGLIICEEDLKRI